MSHLDTQPEIGAVEQCTLVNGTGEKHVFHLHQTKFLLASINGEELDAPGLRGRYERSGPAQTIAVHRLQNALLARHQLVAKSARERPPGVARFEDAVLAGRTV